MLIVRYDRKNAEIQIGVRNSHCAYTIIHVTKNAHFLILISAPLTAKFEVPCTVHQQTTTQFNFETFLEIEIIQLIQSVVFR